VTDTHHAISYIELSVGSNLAATRAFYEQAFGWQFNDYGPGYAGIRAPDGDGEVGGLNAATESVPGGLLVQLYSDDLDASLSGVEAAGGTVAEGPYDYPGGRRFHFTDPAGNTLGVYSSDH
jgi:predicted enzyme related to lactoylglutathione lyase